MADLLETKEQLKKFKDKIEGDLLFDQTSKTIYSTDASAYKEQPLAILIAKSKQDILDAIIFCKDHGISLIPRTAGTSLAGQVVGSGLVVDVSKHFNKIIEINKEESWVRVQPGVVLDELNKILADQGLFFGPETSTSNRCMIGGMIGNNSCGAHSLVYGSTRDHTLELSAFLSDGSEVVFKKLSNFEFDEKCKLENLEGELYRFTKELFSSQDIINSIESEFPDKNIKRRNTGYAIDVLSQMKPFNPEGDDFNFSSLICGSEGTLAFVTEIKLNLVPLPPKEKGLLVVHHHSIDEALVANIAALKFGPVAIELIDKFLLDCTKTSIEHSKNRFFLSGNPEALLCIEFAENTKDEIEKKTKELIEDFKLKGFGFHFPLLFGKDIGRVWALRKAGLGLLSNIPGDAKPQPVIEDTAVSPEKLPDYIREFNIALEKNKLSCVYYAHIATGELHLRPLLNLKEKEGVRLFREVATDISRLVKKYGGSLSGEHGDGRLRGEFIRYMVGDKNYEVLQKLKKTWDPHGIFNNHKIIDTPPMDTSLRFVAGKETPQIDTVFDFSNTLGMVRMAEKCNGSADCRKSEIIGGVMCPSFQATRDERNTTRARANMLREVINSSTINNKVNNSGLFNVLDLCLSCKGCKSECPSGVDMAKLKSEFLFQYYKTNRIPFRSRIISHFSWIQSMACKIPGLYNFVVQKTWSSRLVKSIIGFAKDRSLPKANKITWIIWLKKNLDELNAKLPENSKSVYLFVDEFTNYNELEVGKAATYLIHKLGYRMEIVGFTESGRAKISKGFLLSAKKIAQDQIKKYSSIVGKEKLLVGIEPSAILSFRDEYPDLLRGEEKQKALELANYCITIEEFISLTFQEDESIQDLFVDDSREVKYHGHCQQKVLVGTNPAIQMLSIPKGYRVKELKTGCCGMAGSFGYEKEHYDLSMKIGEMILFPNVRKAKEEEIVVASGTSCRHHIKDGTGKIVKHPVQVLYEALKN